MASMHLADGVRPVTRSDKVLVTGASGFVGQHLVRWLGANGVRVRVFGRHVDGSSNNGAAPIESITGDIRNCDDVDRAMEGVTHVYHLAGKAHDLQEALAATDHNAITVDGTVNLVRCARQSGVERLVFLSSVAVYGRTAGAQVDEQARCRPETPYGQAKLAAEQMIIDAGAHMHVCCVRAPLVYGVGCKGQLTRLIALVERGWVPPLPPVTNMRSMVSVQDLIQALDLAMRISSVNRQVYNVTDGRAYTTGEVLEIICRALGRGAPRWHMPLSALRMLARVGDAAERITGRRLPFDSDTLDKLTGSAHFSAAKIARDLGYRPTTDLINVMPAIIQARRT